MDYQTLKFSILKNEIHHAMHIPCHSFDKILKIEDIKDIERVEYNLDKFYTCLKEI